MHVGSAAGPPTLVMYDEVFRIGGGDQGLEEREHISALGRRASQTPPPLPSPLTPSGGGVSQLCVPLWGRLRKLVRLS